MPRAKKRRKHQFIIPKSGIFRGQKVTSEGNYKGYKKKRKVIRANFESHKKIYN